VTSFIVVVPSKKLQINGRDRIISGMGLEPKSRKVFIERSTMVSVIKYILRRSSVAVISPVKSILFALIPSTKSPHSYITGLKGIPNNCESHLQNRAEYPPISPFSPIKVSVDSDIP